jgi:hypothetical protein
LLSFRSGCGRICRSFDFSAFEGYFLDIQILSK